MHVYGLWVVKDGLDLGFSLIQSWSVWGLPIAGEMSRVRGARENIKRSTIAQQSVSSVSRGFARFHRESGERNHAAAPVGAVAYYTCHCPRQPRAREARPVILDKCASRHWSTLYPPTCRTSTHVLYLIHLNLRPLSGSRTVTCRLIGIVCERSAGDLRMHITRVCSIRGGISRASALAIFAPGI